MTTIIYKKIITALWHWLLLCLPLNQSLKALFPWERHTIFSLQVIHLHYPLTSILKFLLPRQRLVCQRVTLLIRHQQPGCFWWKLFSSMVINQCDGRHLVSKSNMLLTNWEGLRRAGDTFHHQIHNNNLFRRRSQHDVYHLLNTIRNSGVKSQQEQDVLRKKKTDKTGPLQNFGWIFLFSRGWSQQILVIPRLFLLCNHEVTFMVCF